jgi:spermidine synthase
VHVGRAAGATSAAGTLGSLAGTFAATHWLLPSFGCRATLGLCGGVLAALGALLAVRRGSLLAIAGAVAAACLLHRGPLRPASPPRTLLAERESRCQFLQVLEDRSPLGSRRTVLAINEGLDSFHSIAIEGSAFTDGAYYDWHAVVPLLAGDGRRPADLRALSIGDAAGSLRSVYAAVHPGARIDAVDIDADCLALGDEFFTAPKAQGDRHAVDGRVYVRAATNRYHAIHVDAYAHQVYVPAHLASREFFVAAHARLLEGGVIACNVGALRPGDPVLRAIGTTMADVFGHAHAFQVPSSRNVMLAARRGAALAFARLREVVPGTERLGSADAAHWRSILDATGDPRRWHDVGTGGPVLTDDRPLLDALLHASYVERVETEGVVACAGAEDPAGAEAAVYALAQAQDWDGVLAAVGRSRGPTAYLRELAGDARWSLREIGAAIAEYDAAIALTADAATLARLREKQRRAGEEFGPLLASASVAARNGWLALAAAAAAFAAAAAAIRCLRSA